MDSGEDLAEIAAAYIVALPPDPRTFTNDSRPEERAEYLAIRDTGQWLAQRLHATGHTAQAIHLGELLDTFTDDYWTKLRAGLSTQSALKAIWHLLNEASAGLDQATLTFPDGDLPDDDPDVAAGLNHLRRLREAESGIPEI